MATGAETEVFTEARCCQDRETRLRKERAVRFWRRFVGAVVVLLSTVGFIGCLAALVGIWMLHRTAYEKVETISSRFDAGLQRVAIANQNVQRALAEARARVDTVRKESADLGSSEKKSRRTTSALRKLVRQQLEPNITDLSVRLSTLSESAIAVSSLLESFQEVPLAQASWIDSDQLKRRADEGRQLSSLLRRLEVVFSDGDSETGRQEVAAATGEVDLFLQKCWATIDAWESNLDETRGDLAQLKAKIFVWLTGAAIVVTVLCSWIGAGQLSLFACALRWCRAR